MSELPPVDPALVETVSGLQSLLDYRLTGWAPDRARVELTLDARILNRYGIPHGGLYAVLLDTAMGYAGCYTGDAARKQLAMTLSMNVNFVGRPEGTHLITEGWRVGGGRSSFFAEATVRDDTGHLVSTGSGVFRYRKGAA